MKENMFVLSDAFSCAGLVTSTVTVVDFLGLSSSSVEAPARPTPARARIPETLLLKNELFFCSYIFSFPSELLILTWTYLWVFDSQLLKMSLKSEDRVSYRTGAIRLI
jgi:hypothetical protein